MTHLRFGVIICLLYKILTQKTEIVNGDETFDSNGFQASNQKLAFCANMAYNEGKLRKMEECN
ncbi:hypothetical protein PGRAN_12896 [Listeria grandensis FSL F6-0971]|uniref:Uncharacterized protein n=1 Tax=Listeria grandensis FSL F6-0971 TaxID=1265819 RepID=W7BCP5_9LIST|nr:hypothetical protein PGRAN_12896 [Listeria grandensis FSL F6-0971]